MRNLVAGASCAFALWAGTSLCAQDRNPGPREVIPHAQDRPPNPARTPAEAIQAMTVPPGFSVELVAAEPDLVNPVAMTFDEKGRVWVTESLEYPRKSPGPGRDRVKILEDTDGDGKADRFSVFADGLNIPSGIAVGHGGVWVANSPDILFYPDADRDGKADGPPQVVVTGFGRDDTHELPNSLTWGPDGWLYGWNGVFNRSKVKDRHGFEHDFTCAIYRIHPKTRDFEVWCEGTSNPWGIAINDKGDFFASACVIDHLWHLTETGYYIRQGGPYPPHTWPMGSIVDYKHQKAAYCGVHWFDSPAYPPEYRNKLYMGNIHGNCINVDAVEKHGSTYKATTGPDFLSANDAWFMPVVQKTGPDGCLYILDWYDRYHCYQDANRDPAGIDRLKGRLYRVRYQDTPRRVGFDLAAGTDADLIQALGNENIFDRDIAQRLLTERLAGKKTQAGTVAALQALALDAGRPKARRHALWSLIGGLERLDAEFHVRLLADPGATVRAWGVRAAGNARGVASPLSEALAKLRHDPSADVRVQLAVALPKINHSGCVPELLEVLAASAGDPLIPHIVWQNLLRTCGPVEFARLDEFVETAGASHSRDLAALWPRVLDRASADANVTGTTLARLVRFGLKIGGDASLRRQVLDMTTRMIREGRVTGRRLELLRKDLDEAVRPGLADTADPLHPDYVELAAAWRDPAAIDRLHQWFADPKAIDPVRIEAFELLAPIADERLLEALARVLGDKTPQTAALRGQVIERCGPIDSPRVARIVLDAYPRLEPELRPRAIELLTQRPQWSKALLADVAAKRVPVAAFNVNQLRRLQSSKDPEVARHVKELFGTIRDERNQQRELIVGQMKNYLRNAPGDPNAGRAVFTKLCAQCHKIYGEGQEVGPDVTLNGRNDFDQLLSNVFDPNLVIGPAYQATTVATKDGRVLTGLLAEDSDERIVLKTQGGKQEIVPRADVDAVKTAEVSLMPEDVEKQLTPQEIADLFAFLVLDKPPGDPAARRLPGAPAPKPAP